MFDGTVKPKDLFIEMVLCFCMFFRAKKNFSEVFLESHRLARSAGDGSPKILTTHLSTVQFLTHTFFYSS